LLLGVRASGLQLGDSGRAALPSKAHAPRATKAATSLSLHEWGFSGSGDLKRSEKRARLAPKLEEQKRANRRHDDRNEEWHGESVAAMINLL
jgi:hypothetical protein